MKAVIFIILVIILSVGPVSLLILGILMQSENVMIAGTIAFFVSFFLLYLLMEWDTRSEIKKLGDVRTKSGLIIRNAELYKGIVHGRCNNGSWCVCEESELV